MAFSSLPCYDLMEKVGQEVEAIRTHKAQVEQLRKDTLHYHYKRCYNYYFATESYYFPHINSFKDNYKQVVAEIGRNSTYYTNGMGRFKDIGMKERTAEQEADQNTRTYKMPNGVKVITPDGKCLDRRGRPFVPLA